jgi:hypothetical protein
MTEFAISIQNHKKNDQNPKSTNKIENLLKKKLCIVHSYLKRGKEPKNCAWATRRNFRA